MLVTRPENVLRRHGRQIVGDQHTAVNLHRRLVRVRVVFCQFFQAPGQGEVGVAVDVSIVEDADRVMTFDKSPKYREQGKARKCDLKDQRFCRGSRVSGECRW